MRPGLQVRSRARHLKLMEILRDDGYLDVSTLAARLGVSVATVRRDLADLASDGQVVRTRGGALFSDRSTSLELSLDHKHRLRLHEKRQIARVAVDLVQPGETVILDSGSTTWEIAHLLKSKGPLTVVSNGLETLWELGDTPAVTVISPPGIVRPHVLTILGTETVRFLNGLHVNWTFLGADAVDVEHGITNVNLEEVAVKQAMLNAGNRVALVADHSKFGKSVFAWVADLRQVHLVITDRGLPEEMAERIRQAGVELRLAGDAPTPQTPGSEVARGPLFRPAHRREEEE